MTTNIKTKHYVTFYSPGTLYAESSMQEVDFWDNKLAVVKSEEIEERYNSKPYGFRFSTRLEAEPIDDGQGGLLKVEPKTIASSDLYMLGGFLETIDQIYARELDKENILRSNMKYNESYIVCINNNSYRSTIPFNEDCHIVDNDGNIIENGRSPKWVEYRKEAAKKYKDW